MVKTLKTTKSKQFTDAGKACAAIRSIYESQVEFLREQFDSFSKGKIPKSLSQYFSSLIERFGRLAQICGSI